MFDRKTWYSNYSKTPRYKEIAKRASQKYYRTINGKTHAIKNSKSLRKRLWQSQYNKSEKGKQGFRRAAERYRNTLHGRFTLAQKCPKSRKLGWDIDETTYTELIQKPCYYCNGSLNPTGVGLDRLDNNKGYTRENVVPCCKNCNKVRYDVLTPEETKVAVTAVLQYRAARGISSDRL